MGPINGQSSCTWTLPCFRILPFDSLFSSVFSELRESGIPWIPGFPPVSPVPRISCRTPNRWSTVARTMPDFQKWQPSNTGSDQFSCYVFWQLPSLWIVWCHPTNVTIIQMKCQLPLNLGIDRAHDIINLDPNNPPLLFDGGLTRGVIRPGENTGKVHIFGQNPQKFPPAAGQSQIGE